MQALPLYRHGRVKTSKLFEVAAEWLHSELTPRIREVVFQSKNSVNLKQGELAKDIQTLTWSFITWYFVWADLLALFNIDTSFLWNRGTVIRWARQLTSASTPRDLFEKLDRWDTVLCSVQEEEYFYTFGYLVGELTLPGTAKLAQKLMAGNLSWSPEPIYSLNMDGERVNPYFALVRSFLLWFSHIGVTYSADNAVEKWITTQESMLDYHIPQEALTELATVAREQWTKSGLTDHLNGPFESHLSLGAKADESGLRGEPMLTCCTVAQVSKKFLREAAKFNLCWPGRMVVSETDRAAKLITVPKSFKTDRVIIAEPVHKNWLQQSTRKELERWVAKCWHYTVIPSCPDYNRVAVRSLRFATIDLSSASDMVRRELVRACFPKGIVRLLEAGRSPSVILPDKSEMHIVMQSGMGNAHTFPVETHVFRCIIEWARRKNNLKWPHDMRSLQVTHVCVNGDDIIVPVEWYDKVIEALTLFGFKVNQKKSWSDPYIFRESCGVDVYNGNICTPTRLSRRFRDVAPVITKVAVNGLPPDACEEEHLLGLVDLGVNLFLTEHMDSTRRLIYDICRRAGARFSSDFNIVPAKNAVADHAVFAFSALYSPTGDPDITESFNVPVPVMADPRVETVRGKDGNEHVVSKTRACDDSILYQWALASPARELTSRARDYYDDNGQLVTGQSIGLGITYTDYPWVTDGSYRTRYTTVVSRDFAKRIRIAVKAGRKVVGPDVKLHTVKVDGLEPIWALNHHVVGSHTLVPETAPE
jgi:hypothetical protein